MIDPSDDKKGFKDNVSFDHIYISCLMLISN